MQRGCSGVVLIDGLATYHHTAFPMSPTSRSLISPVGSLMFNNTCISAAVEKDHNRSGSGRTITLQVWAPFGALST